MYSRFAHTSNFVFSALVVTLFLVLPCRADDTIKERMLERIPVLTSLKQEGIVGENNRGFLEFRQADKGRESLVNAENADRRQVYEAIARKQGAAPELVGKRRALQIAEIAAPGTWLQDAGGQWYRK